MKRRKIKITNHVKKVIIAFLVSVSISSMGYGLAYYREVKMLSETVNKNLYKDGKKIKELIEKKFIAQLLYELKIYLASDAVKELNSEKISRFMNFVKSGNDNLLNIVVLDKNNKVVYGYIDDEYDTDDREILDKVLISGDEYLLLDKASGHYHIDIYAPIKDDSKKIIGVIYVEVSIKEIETATSSFREEIGVEAYVVDKNGYFVTSSKFIEDAVGNKKIDLKRLKLNINYNSNKEYKDYRGELVFGRYFPLDLDGCTLIIEADKAPNVLNKTVSKTISQIFIFMQGLAIVVLELIFRKKFGDNFTTGLYETITKNKDAELSVKDAKKILEQLLKGDNLNVEDEKSDK